MVLGRSKPVKYRLWRTNSITLIDRWCPSIACTKRRQRDAGRVLTEAVDERQMALGKRQDVEHTGGYSPQGMPCGEGPPRDFEIFPPAAFQTRPSRGLHPRAPLRLYPNPSCAACPGCAKPLYALLQAAPAGGRGALGARQAPRARLAAGGGVRPGGRGEKGFVE